MKIYEMLFQVTPWEVYQEFYDLDDQKVRQSFCEKIIQLNKKEVSQLITSNSLYAVDQVDILNQSYEQFSTYMERLMDLFIQTGQAAIDQFTFFSVIEHEINDSGHIV